MYKAVVSGGEKNIRLETILPQFVVIDNSNTQQLKISVIDSTNKVQRAMWGTARTLLSNNVVGISEGHVLVIRLNGIGYRAALEENDRVLSLKLGYCNPVVLQIPEGVSASCPQPTRIVLESADKHKMTAFAADIRNYRKPEPYNQKVCANSLDFYVLDYKFTNVFRVYLWATRQSRQKQRKNKKFIYNMYINIRLYHEYILLKVKLSAILSIL